MTLPHLLVADPPWLTGTLPTRTDSKKHYKLMTTREIMRLPLPELAPASLLVLWRLSCMPHDWMKVVDAWGFTPKTELVWRKLTKTGKPWFGMGYTLRGSHETAVVCTRGRFKIRCKNNIRTVFDAKVPYDEIHKRYVHSAKPDEFYAIVEQLAGGPGVELFARKRRPGWIQFGDQLPSLCERSALNEQEFVETTD